MVEKFRMSHLIRVVECTSERTSLKEEIKIVILYQMKRIFEVASMKIVFYCDSNSFRKQNSDQSDTTLR